MNQPTIGYGVAVVEGHVVVENGPERAMIPFTDLLCPADVTMAGERIATLDWMTPSLLAGYYRVALDLVGVAA